MTFLQFIIGLCALACVSMLTWITLFFFVDPQWGVFIPILFLLSLFFALFSLFTLGSIWCILRIKKSQDVALIIVRRASARGVWYAALVLLVFLLGWLHVLNYYTASAVLVVAVLREVAPFLIHRT